MNETGPLTVVVTWQVRKGREREFSGCDGPAREADRYGRTGTDFVQRENRYPLGSGLRLLRLLKEQRESHMKKLILRGHSTYDGAGVKLKRVFAHDHTELTDPFLLLDHFGSDNPDDYVKGFPWHPHRGIETVTYMLGEPSSMATISATRARSGPGISNG